MRYEAKHSYFKKVAQVVHNFKNISKSVAKHHQRLMCYRLSNKSTYLTSKNVYGSGKRLRIDWCGNNSKIFVCMCVCLHVCVCAYVCVCCVCVCVKIHELYMYTFLVVSQVKVASLDYGDDLIEGQYDVTEDCHSQVGNSCIILMQSSLAFLFFTHFRVRFAEIQGTKYSKGYVVLCYVEDDMPVFGQITDIIILPTSVCLFVLKPLLSTAFNSHFHSFEVSPVPDILFYQQHELADFHPLCISRAFLSPSSLFVRCKYFVCEQ